MSSKSSKESIASARKREVERLLKELGMRIYSDMNKNIFPEINFPSRSVKNIVYDERLKQYILGKTSVKRSTHNIKHIRPFAQLIWLAFFVNELIKQGKTSTLRDVFYSAQAYGMEFVDQTESDEIITDLEVLLSKAREDFNVYPEERSAIFGDLTIEYTVPGYEGKRLNLASHPDGYLIGPSLSTADFIDTSAEMVLAVEKGGLFTRFVEEKVHKRYKALIIDTAGQPPRATRYMLRRLNQELGLPVYILTDGDVYGEHIAMVIISGSVNAAHLRELTVPSGKWVGVWGSVTGDEPVLIEDKGLLRNEEISAVIDPILRSSRFDSISFDVPNGLKALCCSNKGEIGLEDISALIKHNYNGEVYELITKGGYRVKSTGNHSVEIFDPLTYEFESKKVSEIKEGDLLASCFAVPNNEALRTINLAELIYREAPELADQIFVEGSYAEEFKEQIMKKYNKRIIRKEFSNLRWGRVKLSYFFKEGVFPKEGLFRLRYSSNSKIPITLQASSELGRLLGYYVAKGCINSDNCELDFGPNEHEYAIDAIKCIKTSFGINAKIESKHHTLTIRYGGTLLARIFQYVLKTGHLAKDKRVPFIIFNVPNYVKLEFIRGCFRGDKIINYKEGTRLALRTASRRLAADLVVLLRQLNCVAYTWGDDGRYTVSVSEVDEIQDVVDELCKKPVRNKSELMSLPAELVYNLRHKIRKLVPYGNRSALHRMIFTSNGKGRIGYSRLKTAFNLFNQPVEDSRIQNMVNLVKNKIVLLPIREIRKKTVQNINVYDIEVAKSHTFVGGLGCIVLHNSDIIKYKLPSDPLTDMDIKRIYELKKDPRYKGGIWQEELDLFLKIKRKSELEAFAKYGLTTISDKYLPEKLDMAKSL